MSQVIKCIYIQHTQKNFKISKILLILYPPPAGCFGGNIQTSLTCGDNVINASIILYHSFILPIFLTRSQTLVIINPYAYASAHLTHCKSHTHLCGFHVTHRVFWGNSFEHETQHKSTQ